MKPAVFIDRDGTIIHQVHHLRKPSQVRLLPGVCEALRSLRASGYAVVVVTNQSAVGRGLLSEEALARVHAEMCRQLAEGNAELDGWYFCPVVPVGEERTRIEHPDRKPGYGMLLRAAEQLGLDIGRSWIIGDMVSDALAGRLAGCRGTILVRTGHGADQDSDHEAVDHVAADLSAAARLILSRGEPR